MENKKKSLIKELLRYLVAGGSAFVFDLLTKTLLNSLVLPEDMGRFSVFGFETELRVAIATTAGFIVGLIVNYLISIFFVFTTEDQKKRGKGVKPFLIYLAVSIVGLLVNLGVTQLGCNLLSVKQENVVMFMFVSCVAAGVALIWNYIGRKIFVYKGE
ncbi:MAG: GtrA family protein [Clostridia bacterium]|nr:GtrA family protein [Clostridia bacterium]MBQ9848858.1 GtrA family protein [Clostridia bacterium]